MFCSGGLWPPPLATPTERNPTRRSTPDHSEKNRGGPRSVAAWMRGQTSRLNPCAERLVWAGGVDEIFCYAFCWVGFAGLEAPPTKRRGIVGVLFSVAADCGRRRSQPQQNKTRHSEARPTTVKNMEGRAPSRPGCGDKRRASTPVPSASCGLKTWAKFSAARFVGWGSRGWKPRPQREEELLVCCFL